MSWQQEAADIFESVTGYTEQEADWRDQQDRERQPEEPLWMNASLSSSSRKSSSVGTTTQAATSVDGKSRQPDQTTHVNSSRSMNAFTTEASRSATTAGTSIRNPNQGDS